MFSARFVRSFLALLLSTLVFTHIDAEPSQLWNCTGGSLYFSAHPVDSLLYQNPDLFRDFYVYKCITTVLFTSGDRGLAGNFSKSLERGVEAAYAYMAGVPTNVSAWDEMNLLLNENNVTLRFLRDFPNVQILYLRLPDGDSDGGGYEANGGASLRKLYQKDIDSITSTDGSAVYNLDSLKYVIADLLKQRSPRDIRILDFITPVPEGGDFDREHSDHSISARLVEDVVKQEHIMAKVQGYAGSFMRKLDPMLNETNPYFSLKVETFLTYAQHDKHMCQTSEECRNLDPKSLSDKVPDDVKYVADFLQREYYVS